MGAPNCDSDYYLARVMMRQRFANVHKNGGVKRIKWNVEKLKIAEERKKYNDTVDAKLTDKEILNNIKEEIDIVDKWKEIKEAINMAAKESIGEKPSVKYQEWFDQKYIDIIRPIIQR